MGRNINVPRYRGPGFHEMIPRAATRRRPVRVCGLAPDERISPRSPDDGLTIRGHEPLMMKRSRLLWIALGGSVNARFARRRPLVALAGPDTPFLILWLRHTPFHVSAGLGRVLRGARGW